MAEFDLSKLVEPAIRRRARLREVNVEDIDGRFDHSMADLWKASFGQANLSVAAMRWLRRSNSGYVEGYSPYDDPIVKSTAEMYPEDFEDVHSPQDALDVVERIQQNHEEQRIIAESGALGFFTSFAAGALSVENLIPLSWVGRAAKFGARAAKFEVLMKTGRAVDDAVDAVRGFRLTEAEAKALKLGSIEIDAVNSARQFRNQTIERVIEARGAITPEEVALVDELVALREGRRFTAKKYKVRKLSKSQRKKMSTEEIREFERAEVERVKSLNEASAGRAAQHDGYPTTQDLREFYDQEIDAVRKDYAAKFRMELEAKKRASGGELALTAEETALIDELVEIRTSGPTEKDLREFWESRVGRTPEQGFLDKRTAIERLSEPDFRLLEELARVTKAGPTSEDFAAYYRKTVGAPKYHGVPRVEQVKRGKIMWERDREKWARSLVPKEGAPGVPKAEFPVTVTQNLLLKQLSEDARLVAEDFASGIVQEVGVENGRRFVKFRRLREQDSGVARAASQSPEKLREFWEAEQAASARMRAGIRKDRALLPREERILNRLGYSLEDPGRVLPSFLRDAESFWSGNPKATGRVGLKRFWEARKREGVTRSGQRVMLPREERLYQQLRLHREQRTVQMGRAAKQQLPPGERPGSPLEVPQFTPVVQLPGGGFTSLSRAESILKIQNRLTDRIREVQKALDRGQEVLAKGAKAIEDVRADIAGAEAFEGALVGAVAGGVSEVMLQAMQEGREEEVIGNVMLASAGFGLFFGTLSGMATSRSLRGVATRIEALADDLTDGGVIAKLSDELKISGQEVAKLGNKAVQEVIDRVSKRSPAMGRLIGEDTPGAREALYAYLHLSPAGRLAKSKSKAARKWVHRIADLPLHRSEGGESPINVKSRIQRHHVEGLIALRKARRFGKGEDFDRRVMVAITTDTPDRDPNVNKAADVLREFHGVKKREGSRAGIWDDEPDIGADKGYWHRVLMFEEIAARERAFIDAITPHVGGYDEARKLTQQLLAMQESLHFDPFDSTPTKARRVGPALERKLREIPTVAIQEFVNPNLEYVLNRYAAMTGTQIEYGKLYKEHTGHTGRFTEEELVDAFTMKNARDEIYAEYRMEEILEEDPKKRRKIQEERDRTLSDLEYIQRSHFNVWRRDPHEASGRALASYTTLATSGLLLGKAGAMSLIDLPAVSLQMGAGTFFRTAWFKFRNVLDKLRGEFTHEEWSRGQQDLEWYGHEWTRSGGLFDMQGQGSIEEASGVTARKLTNAFYTFTGLRGITAFNKGFAATGAMDQVIRVSLDLHNGTKWKDLPRRQRLRMESIGIDEALARKIGAEVANGGTTQLRHGTYIPKFDSWRSEELVQQVRGAVIQYVNKAVLSSDKANMPKLFHNSFGSVLGQYLSFPTQATSAYFITGLQRHDFSAAFGAMMMMGVGIFVEGAKSLTRSEPTPWEDLVAHGALKSGVFGLAEHLNTYGSRFTNGFVDIANIFGLETAYEGLGEINDVGDFVPAASAFESAMRAKKDFLRLLNGEQLTPSQTATMLKRMPFINSLLTSIAVESVVKGAQQ